MSFLFSVYSSNGKRVGNGKLMIRELDIVVPVPDLEIVEFRGKPATPNVGDHSSIGRGKGRQKRAALVETNSAKYWVNGRIPYVITTQYGKHHYARIILLSLFFIYN